MIFGYDADLRALRESRKRNAIAGRGARRADNRSECFEAREKFFI